jgi:HEPN domain-containing protein
MNIESEKTVAYWSESAEYDLDTAESLFKAGKYPYALFFGHLALEKILKALVVKETSQHAPFTHSLPLLASKLSLKIPDPIQEELARFMEFYFEARYPEEQKEFYRKCDRNFCEQNLKAIKGVYKWFKLRLEKA